MKKNFFRVTVCLLMALMIFFMASCGTLIYPERIGQNRGRIDPAIAVLNGVGILLFIVPGLIAFIVDFATGAIYLPPSGQSHPWWTKKLAANEPIEIRADGQCIDKSRIESLVSQHTGIPVKIDETVIITSLETPEAVSRAKTELFAATADPY